MTFELRIAIEPPSNEGMGAVMTPLVAYNASKAGGEVPDSLFIAVRDESGAVKGGLVGGTYLGWLSIQAVSLDESFAARATAPP